VVHVGLDVVVGRVVVRLIHASSGRTALHHVARLAQHGLDHLAAIVEAFFAGFLLHRCTLQVAAILFRSRIGRAAVALDGCYSRYAKKRRQGDHHQVAIHFMSILGLK